MIWVKLTYLQYCYSWRKVWLPFVDCIVEGRVLSYLSLTSVEMLE